MWQKTYFAGISQTCLHRNMLNKPYAQHLQKTFCLKQYKCTQCLKHLQSDLTMYYWEKQLLILGMYQNDVIKQKRLQKWESAKASTELEAENLWLK